MRLRFCVRFAIDGDLRFVSHHDLMRLFRRAGLRAGLPLGYSEGFNPQPRVWLPLPRAVGMAADDEVLILELASELPGEAILRRLAAQLPSGLEIRGGSFLDGDRLPQARSATYQVSLSGQQAGDLPGRIEAVLRQEQVVVERRRADGTPVKRIDIRPYLLAVHRNGDTLTTRMGIDERGTARVDEVLRVLELDAESLLHRVRRLCAEWVPPLPCPGAE